MTKMAALTSALMLATSCATTKNDKNEAMAVRPSVAEDVDAQYLILSDHQREIIDKNNQFAVKLFQQVAGLNSTVVSPISVTYLMAMLANGADAQTKADIVKALQLSGNDLDEANALYKMMIERAGAYDKTTVCRLANYLAFNKNIDIKPAYAAAMKDTYHAAVEGLDFTSSKTAARINDWCKKSTEGMIPSIINDVDPNAMAYIMNAIYFNGTWTQKFEKRDTKEEPFRGYTRNIMRVPMMHMTEKLRYGSNDTYASVALPYGNGAYSMTILLPHNGQSVDDVLKAIADKKVNEMGQEASDCIVDLKLPRFTSDVETPLNNVIAKLGAASMFGPQADFSHISNSPLFVSKMFQKAKIEVSEEGTKAAAVTAAIMTMSALPTEQPKHVTFHANHPFVYMITENNTGSILFMGQYAGE